MREEEKREGQRKGPVERAQRREKPKSGEPREETKRAKTACPKQVFMGIRSWGSGEGNEALGVERVRVGAGVRRAEEPQVPRQPWASTLLVGITIFHLS